MAHIHVKKGLDIPIDGYPESQNVVARAVSSCAYDFRPFDEIPLRLCVDEGEKVSAGQILAQDMRQERRVFVAPFSGRVVSCVRGNRRKLLSIVLEKDEEQPILSPQQQLIEGKREDIVDSLLKAGLFMRIRRRPFDICAHPDEIPQAIFVKAAQTAPLVPQEEMQIQGREEEFRCGLSILSKLAEKPVQVIVKKDSPIIDLCQSLSCAHVHTISGPHPSSNLSLAIEKLSPITSMQDRVWTVSSLDVIAIGAYCLHGAYSVDSVISLCGPGMIERKYVRALSGASISGLLKTPIENVRLISGGPLTGVEVTFNDFLRDQHTCLCAISVPENERTALHFLRFKRDVYSAEGAYMQKGPFVFSTSQHGEERAYVDGSMYESVMPFSVLPIFLIKALLANDMDKALEYGLLEVVPEDFALADFICPSKLSMMDTVRQAQKHLDTVG